MLPHTGSDAAPSYSAELLALGAGEGHDNEDLHHRYIYAHNMTTVRMLADGNGDDVPDMNACDRVASSFIGAGLQALHVVPDGTDGPSAWPSSPNTSHPRSATRSHSTSRQNSKPTAPLSPSPAS